MENKADTTKPLKDRNILHILVVDQDNTLYDDEGDSVIAPGEHEMNIGILPFHTPFYTRLYKGKIEIQKGKDKKQFDIESGIARVINNDVIILLGF